MFEFRWAVPGPTAQHDVRLQIRARNGWVGRKLLFLDNQLVLGRGSFAGINHRFAHPDEAGKVLELRAVQQAGSRLWIPQLTRDGHVVPELTQIAPPPVPDRTASVAIVTGLVYLTMLMALVMLPHIWRMLYAGLGHSDNRAFVLTVVGNGDREGLRLQQEPLMPAVVNRPYEATIEAEGGAPPYAFTRTAGLMPDGLEFDESDGRIHGTPRQVCDTVIGVEVADKSRRKADWHYVISVKPPTPSEPRIVTETLPPARVGEPYHVELEVAGGKPTYDWVVNDRKLPKGLKLTFLPKEEDRDRRLAILDGTPESGDNGPDGEPAEHYPHPLRFRVYDSSYSPAQHVYPWFAPFVVTAVCLLGYWNMRRWSVLAYGMLIVAQVGAFVLLRTLVPDVVGNWSLTAVGAAVVLQALTFGVGVVSLGRMR